MEPERTMLLESTYSCKIQSGNSILFINYTFRASCTVFIHAHCLVVKHQKSGRFATNGIEESHKALAFWQLHIGILLKNLEDNPEQLSQ